MYENGGAEEKGKLITCPRAELERAFINCKKIASGYTLAILLLRL